MGKIEVQIATAEQHKKFFDFLRESHGSLLSLFTDETVTKLAKQFVFEQEAARALDDEAISEGYESAADRAFQIAEKKKADDARAKAEAEAIEKARKDKEDAELAAKVEADRIAQLKRDLADAEAAAKAKAEKAAQEMGVSLSQG